MHVFISNPVSRRADFHLWAVALVACLYLFACAEEVRATPDELIGIWRSDDPRYADRTFEIRADQLFFGTGEFGAPKIHSIISVTPPAEGAKDSLWIVSYRESDGETSEMSLVYVATPKPTLQFANRSESWRRVKGGGPNES